MATEKITTLKNVDKTVEILPRTKVRAISNDDGVGLDTLLVEVADTTLSNAKLYTDGQIAQVKSELQLQLESDKVLISDESGKVVVSSVTSTELEYLSGVNSNIQEHFDAIDNTLGDISTALNSILGV